jgi:hypothetical protein
MEPRPPSRVPNEERNTGSPSWAKQTSTTIAETVVSTTAIFAIVEVATLVVVGGGERL